ncbi:MAG TPA: branched-chain amino acid ABC transporter ATP-binding protein/permease [Pseudolabrys sp.]|nr:branched-chain amino acid ABC transporter ATP-binding protein/permease [Pseudolabrys sp.]
MIVDKLSARGPFGRWLPEAAAVVALLIFPTAFALIGGTADMADRILIWGIFGLGFDILFGFTGLLSFGQAAFFGSGGFMTAYLLISGFTDNALVALLIGTVFAAILGVIIGALSLRRSGIYFAMLTLAFGEMFYFLDISPLKKYTGGENGLSGVPATHIGIGNWFVELHTPEGMYWVIAILFLIGFWLARRIVNSSFGAVLLSIRENGERARTLGHDIQKYKLAAFVIAAAYAGVAGSLFGLFQGYMPPDGFYLETSGQLVVQTIMGGAGTLVGPTVGALVWIYLRTALQQLPIVGPIWKMVLGIIFVLIVTLFRRGICGGIALLWERLTGKEAATPPAAPAAAAVVADNTPRTRTPLTGKVILEARDLTKRYGGLTAVDKVSFEVVEGEIRALIGPNGAGKTTFFNMLAGAIPPTGGEMFFRGERITSAGSTAICQRGLVKSFQINQLFPSLTVWDNVRIPAIARTYGKFHPSMLRNVGESDDLNKLIAETLAAVNLSERAHAPARELAYGEKRRLEIGLALATKPSTLLLDEPTAGMSPSERQDTVRLLKRIAAGVTIVIVEHDMDVVFGLADRVTVLFNGRKIADGTPDAIKANPEVRAAYLGNPVQK